MARSRIIHPNLQVLEITGQFHQAVNILPAGQLVKDEGFSLFEAVGALEIGDPKMDSGCRQFEANAEDEADVLAPLTDEQLIWLIDEHIRREVSWHQGYPLSQTLLTSVYIDKLLWPDPKQLDDAQFDRTSSAKLSSAHQILRAYCLALVKCCDLVLAMVTSQHYYEEEDFATQLYNREMLHRFHPNDVYDEMNKVRLDLDSKVSHSSHVDALTNRFDNRMALLRLLIAHTDAEPAYGAAQQALSTLGQIQKLDTRSEEVKGAFSIKLQRRLASSVPPRPMVAAEKTAAFAFMQRFVQDSNAIFELFSVTSPADLYTAFWTLMSQSSQPSVYVRALAQSFLNINNQVLGLYDINAVIIDDLRSLVLPTGPMLDPANDAVENPFDNRYRIVRQVESFVAKVGPSHLNELRSFCQNRCRVRRNLCHALLEWDNLQADAEDIDGTLQTLTNEEPRPYPVGEANTFAYSLSSWVYHYKLTQLRLAIQTGFELSVYAPHEYADMYCYLSHTASTHLSHLERMSYFVSTKASHQSEIDHTLKVLYRHFSYLKAVDTLSSALHRIFVILQRHGHFQKVRDGYASEQLRFELRMRPFQYLSIPEPLTHEMMEKLASLRTLSDKQILDQAARLCQASKKSWEEISKAKWNTTALRKDSDSNVKEPSVIAQEWSKDVRNSLKACIGTSLAIAALSKMPSDSSRGRGTTSSLAEAKIAIAGPENPIRFHKWWAVPSVR